MASPSASSSSTVFDASSLIPKAETAASLFVRETGYAGKNCIVGVLDTGIDPATNRYMADGVTPKLINVIDCTGSGDVDVSTEAKAEFVAIQENIDGTDSYWEVVGLTGRTLKLPISWKIEPFPNHDEEEKPGSDETITTTAHSKGRTVRLGIKRAYELFPQALVERVKQERKKQFDLAQAPHIATVREKLSAWNATYNNNNNTTSNNNTTTDLSNKPDSQKIKERDDLQALLEVLTESTEDPGPVYDCVVFWDGSDYRAVVDVHETGDLRDGSSSCKPLAAFPVEREYGTFGVSDQLNFAVQFYRNGRLLSLVTDCSPHGTHVASIAASAQYGVAPEAQLISFKIGEPRLGTMETGPALERAMHEAVKLKCDVINLSYGEAVQVADRGRFVEQAKECVWKHGVVFVAAAGNQGPALSSVDAPGATTSACIGVAAYISPAMRNPLYSCLPEPESCNDGTITNTVASFPETTYTWSSTGPTADADFGVNVTAPGGAIATVPNWCLQKSRLMNGTSMASPHVTGCIALLISACKAEKIAFSPARIRRALENSAKIVPNLLPLQQGWGMVQVDAAWEYLKAHSGEDTEDIYFAVNITSLSGKPRGVYLRQPDESAVRQTFAVAVDPQFKREDSVSEEMQREKIDLEMHFRLETTESWVVAPSNFVLMNDGRSFEIEVDPTRLKPGVHTSRVCGVQVDKPDRKVLFSVPITVIKPLLPVQRTVELGSLEFDPAEVKRFFVVPPHGTTWMDVTLRDTRDAATDSDASQRLIALHTVQLLSHAAFRENECSKRMTLMPGQTSISSIAVEQGVTCEVALARYWSTRGPTRLFATVQFRGTRPVPNEVNIVAGSGGAMVRIYSDLENEMVNPTAKLTKWQSPLRPKADCVISPLQDERDSLPYPLQNECDSYRKTSPLIFTDEPTSDKKTYQLILTYEFEQEEKGLFVPRAPALQGVLYEAGFGSQCMMIFDGEKKYLGMADAYPSGVNAPKGTVIIRLQIRHDDPSKLEKLKDMVIWIERNLSKEIPLAAYPTREELVLGRDKFPKRTVRRGCSAAVFFAEPVYSTLPSGCAVGHRLVGVASYEADDSSLPGDGKKPGGFPIFYTVGPKPSKEATVEAEPAEPTTKPTVEQKMDDAVRDLKVEFLGKLTSKEKEEGKFDELYVKLESEYPDHLPLLMAKLRHMDTHQKRSEMLNEVIRAAESVISRISEDELALNLGRKVDLEDGNAIKKREEIKEKKSFLIEALVRMALAYANSKSDEDKFHETLKRLKAWVDFETYNKYAALNIENEMRAGRHGLALKQINKLLTKNEIKEKDMIQPLTRSDLMEKRAAIFEKLGYSLLAEYDKRTRVIACPKKYTPF